MGTHWYTRTGKAIYTTEMATKPGQFRQTTKADAKKHGHLPSVTSVTGDVVYSETLYRWAVNGHVEIAGNNPRDPGESVREYNRRIAGLWKEQSSAAPELGTAIHQSIDDYLAGQEYDKQHSPYVLIAENFLNNHRIKLEHLEYSFSNPELGYGGKMDVLGNSDAHDFIVDWKTKKTLPGGQPYWNYGVQLEAYARGIGRPYARLINVMMSTTEPGKWEYYEWPMRLKPKLWRMWEAAYSLWVSPMFADWDPRQWTPKQQRDRSTPSSSPQPASSQAGSVTA